MSPGAHDRRTVSDQACIRDASIDQVLKIPFVQDTRAPATAKPLPDKGPRFLDCGIQNVRRLFVGPQSFGVQRAKTPGNDVLSRDKPATARLHKQGGAVVKERAHRNSLGEVRGHGAALRQVPGQSGRELLPRGIQGGLAGYVIQDGGFNAVDNFQRRPVREEDAHPGPRVGTVSGDVEHDVGNLVPVENVDKKPRG